MQGPWPPHQEPRPDPDGERLGPVAVPDPRRAGRRSPRRRARRRAGPAAPTQEARCTRPASATRPRARIDEAIALLHEGGGEAKVLAGGQSLVPLLKLRFASPELLVDINNLPDLDYHRVDADGTLHDRCALPARRPRALHAPGRAAADDGRRRAPDRRPDRAQPRHAGRLAVPRRPAGRLGRGDHRARRPRRRPGPGGPPHDRRSPTSSPARSRTPWPTTRWRSRRSSRRRRARWPAATSSSSAGSATSRPPAPRSPSSSRRPGHAGRHRADRRRRPHHRRRRGRRLARRPVARPPSRDRAGRRPGRRRRPEPRSDHRGSADYKRHIIHTFVTRILTRVPPPEKAA